MNKIKYLIFVFIGYLLCGCSSNRNLTNKIDNIIKDKNLRLGVAVYDFDSKKTFSYNGTEKFPMQSVYKLPISIAVLDLVDKGVVKLNDSINIDKNDLSPNLYSPIRNKYPNGVKMPLSEIISYTISQSDNIGCDILISMAGGAECISAFLASNSLDSIKIINYEREIQSDLRIQFDNWTTPNAITNFLKKLNNRQLLSSTSTNFIWEVMTQSNTGSINRLLPSDVEVGYKTGYSGVGADGYIAAQNCVGIMKQGDKCIIFAVFITDSKESRDINMDIIAHIGKVIYNTYFKNK